MTKEKGETMKGSKAFKEFVDNIRATRRSKAVGIDIKMLTQIDTSTLLVEFFKANNDIFLKLIKFERPSGGISK